MALAIPDCAIPVRWVFRQHGYLFSIKQLRDATLGRLRAFELVIPRMVLAIDNAIEWCANQWIISSSRGMSGRRLIK